MAIHPMIEDIIFTYAPDLAPKPVVLVSTGPDVDFYEYGE